MSSTPTRLVITETRSGEWMVDFKKHVEEGGYAVVRIENQEMVNDVCVLSMGIKMDVPIGSIVVAYSVEPTVWAVCDDTDDLRSVVRAMAARQASLQVALQLRIVRPQDGARTTYNLPMRHDIHDTIRTTVDLPGTFERILAQLFRHLDAIVERLGGHPACVYCAACIAVGANETELRVVSDDVPFVNVTLRSKCAACTIATPSAGVIVGATDEAREDAVRALHDHQG